MASYARFSNHVSRRSRARPCKNKRLSCHKACESFCNVCTTLHMGMFGRRSRFLRKDSAAPQHARGKDVPSENLHEETREHSEQGSF